MSDTLFQILAPAWALLGAIVLTLAIFRDVIRQHIYPRLKQRRCPKCWYDLSHTQGFRCNECGYTAKSEKQLRRSRRSQRGIYAALIIFAIAYTCTALPRVMKRGWPGWIPTTLLAVVVPQLTFDEDLMGAYVKLRPISYSTVPKGTTSKLGLTGRLAGEWADRAGADELSSLSWFLFLKLTAREARQQRYMDYVWSSIFEGAEDQWKPALFELAESAGHLENRSLLREIMVLPSFRIRTRDRWPIGVPLYAELGTTEYFDGENVDATLIHESSNQEIGNTKVLVGRAGPPACYTRPEQPWWFEEPSMQMIGLVTEVRPTVQFSVKTRRKIGKAYRDRMNGVKKLNWDNEISLPVQMVDSIDEVLQGVESKEIEAVLATMLNPFLHESRGSTGELVPHLHLSDPHGFGGRTELLEGLTLAVQFEVLRDGELIYGGSAWWDQSTLDEWRGGGNYATANLPPRLLVELSPVGSPSVAPPSSADRSQWQLRIIGDPELALRNFDCDRYWSGSVTLPIAWEEPPNNAN